MTAKPLSDAALLESLSELQQSQPVLAEYVRRQEGRVARQREVTRLILQLLRVPVFPVVDLEATCFDTPAELAAHSHEVIEVGWALLAPATGALVDSRQFYVKPTTTWVSEYCTRLTGIRPDQVEHAPSFALVMYELGALHKSLGIKFWGGYGEFDQAQLRRQCANEGVQYPWEGHDYLNLKELAGAYFGFGKRSPGLARAMARAGLEFQGRHHSGVDDARNTARLLAWMLGR
jgi:inhibitor of KinA sporulation pathway (predicted exonuclease)